MKFCTLIVFDLLSSNLPGAKDDSQWGRRIWHSKMAATQKHKFSYSRLTKLCKSVHRHEILHTYSFGPAEFKSAESQGRYYEVAVFEILKWPPPKNTNFPIPGWLNCANLSTGMKFCTLIVSDLLSSKYLMGSPYLTFQNGRHPKKHIFTLLVK